MTQPICLYCNETMTIAQLAEEYPTDAIIKKTACDKHKFEIYRQSKMMDKYMGEDI